VTKTQREIVPKEKIKTKEKKPRGCLVCSRKTLGLVEQQQSVKVAAHQQHPLSKAQGGG